MGPFPPHCAEFSLIWGEKEISESFSPFFPCLEWIVISRREAGEGDSQSPICSILGAGRLSVTVAQMRSSICVGYTKVSSINENVTWFTLSPLDRWRVDWTCHLWWPALTYSGVCGSPGQRDLLADPSCGCCCLRSPRSSCSHRPREGWGLDIEIIPLDPPIVP